MYLSRPPCRYQVASISVSRRAVISKVSPPPVCGAEDEQGYQMKSYQMGQRRG